MPPLPLRLAALLLFAIAPAAYCMPLAPTNLVVEAPGSGEINLTWEDNADDEESYRVQFRIPPATAWITAFTSVPDTTEAGLTGATPGTTFEFRVLAVAGDDESPSNIVNITTPDAFNNSTAFAFIRPGEPFNFDSSATNGADSASVVYSATSLPAGLAIDPTSGEITGTTTDDGHFQIDIEVSYNDPVSAPLQRELSLRLPPQLAPPELVTPLPATALVQLVTPPAILLDNHFADPDTRTAVRMDTTHGDIIFSLFDVAMPLPVANFLTYLDRENYSATVFHRSVNIPGLDIIQGGSFTGDGAALSTFPADPPITNAPGIPNDRGTLAFARSSNPDSATSGWYINAGDSPGIDQLTNAFSVFGRATTASLAVIDTIFAFETVPHTLPVDGSPGTVDTWPTTDGETPTSPAPGNLVIVNTLTRIPALTYSLDSNSAPAVATATLADGGAELLITPLTPGQTELQLTTTDIDGNTLPATHTITVQSSYPAWIAAENIAPNPEGLTDNPGGGSFNNLQSYAFGSAPLDPLEHLARSPHPTTAEFEAETYNALTFYHRKFVSDLVYTVQYTADLNIWTDIWTSAEGFEDNNVVALIDDGDFWQLTVRKDTPANNEPIVLFRVAVTHPGLDE